MTDRMECTCWGYLRTSKHACLVHDYGQSKALEERIRTLEAQLAQARAAALEEAAKVVEACAEERMTTRDRLLNGDGEDAQDRAVWVNIKLGEAVRILDAIRALAGQPATARERRDALFAEWNKQGPLPSGGLAGQPPKGAAADASAPRLYTLEQVVTALQTSGICPWGLDVPEVRAFLAALTEGK